jgi:hypothetical protein
MGWSLGGMTFAMSRDAPATGPRRRLIAGGSARADLVAADLVDAETLQRVSV